VGEMAIFKLLLFFITPKARQHITDSNTIQNTKVKTYTNTPKLYKKAQLSLTNPRDAV